MKKILVPIQFNDPSFNALAYAISMYPDGKITVLHVSNGFNQKQYPTFDKNKSLIENLKQSLIEKINASFSIPSKCKINVQIEIGEIVTTIANLTKKVYFDACFIGLRDKHNLLNKLIGTNAVGIVKSLKIPVYAIPKFSSFYDFNKVIIGADEHMLNKKYIQRISKWNEAHLAFLKFVHIKKEENASFQKEKENLVDSLFEENKPSFSFEISQIDGDNVADNILGLAYNEKAELVMVIPENQNFLGAILLNNVSKEIIEKAKIPILFLND